MKKIIILIILVLILIVSIVFGGGYIEYVTIGQGDIRWCQLTGCTIADLIVDSLTIYNLSVIGQIFNFGGNLTAENIFLPQYVFSHTNETIVVLGASEWTNITFTQEVADVKRGIEHSHSVDSHVFTLMEDGIYEFDYDLDLEDGSGTPTLIDVAGRVILVNGSELLGSVFETDISKQGTEAELSHDFLVACKAGDQLVFQFVGTDPQIQISTHGTFGVHPESATVVINKIANLP